MATPYLAITDGTTTVTIASGTSSTSYHLPPDGWVPNVAGLRDSVLAGRGPYSEVVEEMTLDITGATAAACYTNLNTLARLLDQAQRWYMGENVSAVLIKYAPINSTVSSDSTPLQAAILGRADGDGTLGIGLSPKWHQSGLTFVISGVRVRFIRRGLWLLSTTADSSTATNNGTLAAIDFGAALTTAGPTKVVMSDYPSGGGTDGGFLILTKGSASKLSVVDPSGGTASGWTSVNESANYAQFTNVLRYTPGATTESTSGNITITIGSGNVNGLVAVFANIRNNSNTTSFLVRARFNVSSAWVTPLNYVAPYSGAVAPNWVFLGVVGVSAVTSVSLMATASAASGTIDFGAVAAVDVLYPYTYVLAYRPSASDASTKTLTIDHALLTYPQTNLLDTNFWVVTGDTCIHTIDQNVDCANLITKPSSNDWRQTTTVPAVSTNTFTLTRYTGYLVPQ